MVVDEAQVIKNHQSDTAQELRRLSAHSRLALTGTPVENGLGDLWAILDFTNPGSGRTQDRLHRAPVPLGLRRSRPGRGTDAAQSPAALGGGALRALNGLLIFRRTKTEPEIAAELPDKVDKLDHCSMTAGADRPLPGRRQPAARRQPRAATPTSARVPSSPPSPR